jgi:hypothetical protein
MPPKKKPAYVAPAKEITEVNYKPKNKQAYCNIKVITEDVGGAILYKVLSTRTRKPSEVLYTSRFPVTLKWNGDKNTRPTIAPKVPTIGNLVSTFVHQVLRRKQGGIQMNKKLFSDILLYGKLYNLLYYVDRTPPGLATLPENGEEAIRILTEALKNQIESSQEFWKESHEKSGTKYNFSLKGFYNTEGDFLDATEDATDKDTVNAEGDFLDATDKDIEQSPSAGESARKCQDDNPLLSGHDEADDAEGLDLLLN